MKEFDVVVLTESRYIRPDDNSPYVQNILTEDRLIMDALLSRGLLVDRKEWTDQQFDWSDTRAVVFRTTWDYFDKVELFRRWLNLVDTKCLCINDKETILWNIDKHYLADLAQNNVPVIPTHFTRADRKASLSKIMKDRGWNDVVIKPAVGGAGRLTYRILGAQIKEFEDQFAEWTQIESFMVQPFQRSVPAKGEVSHMFFGDHYSHSILKRAKDGDFRVQDDFGGTVHPYEASEEEIRFGLHAIRSSGKNPTYARVDVIEDNNGRLAVSELELVEPELWMRMNPESADIFADQILMQLES
ncbi:RimK family alpha-L-glutamate ligase [Balneola sp. MJW-20]|uniref:ATP-grasp domain-containing protein n=1 Tax=Gracilimonas aurantiaca TaxID=3234185 RepID=UPI003467A497